MNDTCSGLKEESCKEEQLPLYLQTSTFPDDQGEMESNGMGYNEDDPRGKDKFQEVICQVNNDKITDCDLNENTTVQQQRQSTDGCIDTFEIATRDDVDAGSVYSLYMEQDFRYHFQHPYFRLFTAYFVTFCNFLIYAEDPVAHSRSECSIPVLGNDFSFVVNKYPSNGWAVLKVSMWLMGIVAGIVIGKLFFHTYLFMSYGMVFALSCWLSLITMMHHTVLGQRKWDGKENTIRDHVMRLKMFHDDRGTWMTMFMSTVLVLFIVSWIYNLVLLIGGSDTESYHITSYMGFTYSTFMKMAATGTWCGDFFTAWMVTDIMLQEKLYPDWARPLRQWWNTGIRRIFLFWIAVFVSSFVVIFVIATDYINWDSLNRDFLHSNEVSRAFLASFILCSDITIVMQDWDFPHFVGAIDVKLPGINKAHIYFRIPKLLKSLEYWHVHISGKWFNYGILFVVIMLDLNMWKNQIFYTPYQYGQYVDDLGRIHTVTDFYSIDNGNSSTLTFEYRNNTINPNTGQRYILDDRMMNARYNGYSRTVKMLAFVPSLTIFLVFGLMVGIYGRRPRPTRLDPYGGRLRKRRRRFSAREKWNSLRSWFSSIRVKRGMSSRTVRVENEAEPDGNDAKSGTQNRNIEDVDDTGGDTSNNEDNDQSNAIKGVKTGNDIEDVHL